MDVHVQTCVQALQCLRKVAMNDNETVREMRSRLEMEIAQVDACQSETFRLLLHAHRVMCERQCEQLRKFAFADEDTTAMLSQDISILKTYGHDGKQQPQQPSKGHRKPKRKCTRTEKEEEGATAVATKARAHKKQRRASKPLKRRFSLRQKAQRMNASGSVCAVIGGHIVLQRDLLHMNPEIGYKNMARQWSKEHRCRLKWHSSISSAIRKLYEA